MTDEANNGLPWWLLYKTKGRRTACAAPPAVALEALVMQLISIDRAAEDRVVQAIYQHKRKKDAADKPTAAEEQFACMFRDLLRPHSHMVLKAIREVEPGKRRPHHA